MIQRRAPSLAAPGSLREALGLTYTYRERVRWLIGASALLGTDYTRIEPDTFAIDARKIPEFTQIAPGPAGLRIGAFAPLEAIRAHPDAGSIFADAIPPALRLALSDATMDIVALGRQRTLALDAKVLAPHEVPIFVTLPKAGAGGAVIVRTRSTNDRDASFHLLVAVSLRLSALGRFEKTRIALALNYGDPIRARKAEEALDRQKPDPYLIHDAARHAAATIDAVDAGTSAAARAALPLVLSALKEAVASTREPRS